MKDSWLTPEGKIIEVGDFMHNEYAQEMLEEEMGWEELHDYMTENRFEYPYEVLHNRGWVRIKFNTSYLPKVEILGGCISLINPMRNTIDPAMNNTQLKVAKCLCEELDTDFNTAINDKRFW